MRENIGLFKAKTKDVRKCWVEGYYVSKKAYCTSPHAPIWYDKHFICVPVRSETYEYFEDIEIDPETLCECTGVKDKNGRLIFENDYVKQEIERQGYSSGEPNDDLSFFGCIYGTVKFRPSTGFFIQVSDVEDYMTGEKTKENWKTRKQIVSYRTEVIGNKFEEVESEN